MEKSRENIWNVPNVLTMLRMALIPVFLIFYYDSLHTWALIAFLAASLTDVLDGYIARKYHLVTNFGKLMDPLADKLMVITVLLCQTISGTLPRVAVFIIVAKELIMVLGGIYMLKRGIVVYSEIWGKAAQFIFSAALVLSFFHSNLTAIHFQADVILLWISVGLTLISLCLYARNAIQNLKKQTVRQTNQ